MSERTQEEVKNLWDHIVQEHDGFLYRYEETCYSRGVDEFDNPYPGYTMVVYLYKYRVIKQTKKGVWIRVWSRNKFVRFDARKKFACLTKEEALESYKARRRSQIKILKGQLKQAEKALRIVQDPAMSRLCRSLIDDEKDLIVSSLVG